MSIIRGDYQGDAWFSEFNEADWQITLEQDEGAFLFRKYRRIGLSGQAL